MQIYLHWTPGQKLEEEVSANAAAVEGKQGDTKYHQTVEYLLGNWRALHIQQLIPWTKEQEKRRQCRGPVSLEIPFQKLLH